MTLDRKPLQIVEIDIGYCSNTYGSAPCTAALTDAGVVRKCYNTYFTCQDKDNYTASTLTLRFAMNQSGIPLDTLVYPALAAPVAANPAEIQLGGVGDKIGSLGKRARVEVRLKDFKDSDIYTDKYQSERVDGTAQDDEGGYNPKDRGSFFGKLRRRHPYYQGRALRVLEGYEGDALASMRTRHYVIDEWVGPDAVGNVKITAKDVLELADDKKSVAPVASRGKLAEDISDTYTSTVDLVPEGIGAEYPASGRISIGSEILSFTRSTDTLTITGRGLDGTEAADHDAEDLVQECYRVEDVALELVIQELLEDYAGVDSSFITIADWTAERTRWLGNINLTATIPKPTGVAKLIGEILDLGVFLWWDETGQEVKFRANRPLDYDETAPELNDNNTFLEGSVRVRDLDDKRLSRIIFWHDQIDASGSAKDGANFRQAFVAIDAEAETSTEYNQTRLYEIFCRWLGPGNTSIVQAVATRLLNRYRDTPREIEFHADVKDETNLRIGTLLTVNTRSLQDDTGNAVNTQVQLVSVEEIQPGHRLKAKVQEYDFRKRFGFITENARNDYGSSTAAQLIVGTYIASASDAKFADGTNPYLIF